MPVRSAKSFKRTSYLLVSDIILESKSSTIAANSSCLSSGNQATFSLTVPASLAVSLVSIKLANCIPSSVIVLPKKA